MLNLPKIIGHRGVKGIVPENTTLSIEKAIEFNIQWIEVDVKISRDKKPFLLHDDVLDRTTSGKGSPANLDYNKIRDLDAGSWFDKSFANLYPPTLEEVLHLCSDKNIGINIELKPNNYFEKQTVLSVYELFKKINYKKEYFFSSFDLYSCKLIKKLMPTSNVGILIDDISTINNFHKIIEICKNNNFFSCGLNKKIISDEVIFLCKKNNILVSVYSDYNINLNESYNLWNKGISSIFIDDPKEYKEILKKL